MKEIEGIVLSCIDYKEKSKIVYLYTTIGHDSVKAVKAKDISSGLLPFTTTLNEVVYLRSNTKFPVLLEFQLQKSNYDLVNYPVLYPFLKRFLVIVKSIPNDSNHEHVYKFIIEILHQLNVDNHKKLLAIFLIKMLYIFGIQPNFKECLRCKSIYPSFFSIRDGGFYCNNCLKKNNIEVYKIWKEYYFDKKDISEYSDCDFDAFLDDIYMYYQIHAHIYLKNLDDM